jgi:hypothetical protein
MPIKEYKPKKTKGIYKKCLFCKDTFYCYQYEKDKRKFCSKECVCKEHKLNPKFGKDNLSYKERVINNCKICGKNFGVVPSHNWIKHCSKECFKISCSKRKANLGNKRIGYCLDCNKELKYAQSKRCPLCNNKWQSKLRKDAWERKEYRNLKLSQMKKNWEENSSLRSGENSQRWLGGKSFEPYDMTFNEKFKRSIRKRDNQVCMNCGKHREKLNRALGVHHIDFNKLNSIEQNCISLCDSCHMKTNVNREYWTKLFQEKLFKLYGYLYSDKGEIIIDLNAEAKKFKSYGGLY